MGGVGAKKAKRVDAISVHETSYTSVVLRIAAEVSLCAFALVLVALASGDVTTQLILTKFSGSAIGILCTLEALSKLIDTCILLLLAARLGLVVYADTVRSAQLLSTAAPADVRALSSVGTWCTAMNFSIADVTVVRTVLCGNAFNTLLSLWGTGSKTGGRGVGTQSLFKITHLGMAERTACGTITVMFAGRHRVYRITQRSQKE